jgi:Trypsin-co-occurring domain 1
MGKIVKLKVGKSRRGQKREILIQTADNVGYKGRIVETGRVENNFDKMLEMVKPFCESIIESFEGLAKVPDSASAEFGLSIAGEGNLFIVKASAEASIKVTLEWSFNNYGKKIC